MTNRNDSSSHALRGFERALEGSANRREVLAFAAGLGLAVSTVDIAGATVATAPSSGLDARFQDDKSTLTIALDSSPSDLDPHSANDYRSIMVNRNVYETLAILKDDKLDEYEPLVAESWQANEDSSVWTFTIRSGLTFQDGTPCDAAAVAASFGRMITLGYGPSFELGRFIQSPDQVTAPDAVTVVFNLGKPQPFLMAGLASIYGGQIVNVAAAMANETDGDQGHTYIQTNPTGMGTGPFIVTDFQPGELVVLERNESYWRGWADDNFERVVIRVVPEVETRRQLIERGEADIIDNITPEAVQALTSNADLVVDSHFSTSVDYLIMTVAGPLASPTARQALCHAFPYDDVIQGVYGGFAKRAIGPVAELTKGFDPDTFTYPTDLAKAKELLAAAGVAEGTSLSAVQSDGEQLTKTVLQLFQANLSEIGIDLQIETVDQATFIDYLFRDATADEQPNILPWYWSPVYNDAYDHLQLMVLCGAAGSAGTNAGYYCNEDVDAGMTAARDAADDATYQSAMSDVQRILSEVDPPAIYYAQREWTGILNKRVAGYVFNPINTGSYDLWKLRFQA